MAVQPTNDLSTIIFAVLSSSVLAAILTKALDFYFNKISYKRNTSHENKIIEIKNFYKSFQTFKLEIESYHFYTMFSTHNPEKTQSISDGLIPFWRDFQYQCMIIKLFLDEKEYNNVIKVENSLLKMKKDMDSFHLNSDSPYSNLGERMLEILEVDLKTILPELMNSIETSLRKSFA